MRFDIGKTPAPGRGFPAARRVAAWLALCLCLAVAARAGEPGPGDLFALTRARELLDAGRAQEALEQLQPRVKGPDAHPLVFFFAGTALLSLDRPSDAATSFRAALDKDPALSPAWQNLGLALSRTGDHSGAALALEKAYETRSGEAPDLLARAAGEWELAGEPQDAARTWETLIQDQPGNMDPAWQEGLARALLAGPEAEKALDVLLGLAENAPAERREAWQRVLVHSLDQWGDQDRALSLAGRFTAQDPGNPEWWRIRARLFLEANQGENALACLLAAGFLEPLSEKEAILAGDLARSVGVPALAARLYQDAGEPDGPDLYLRLATAWSQAREPEEALKWADEGLSRFSGPRLAMMKAELLWELSRFPEAARAYEAVAPDAPEPGRAWLMAAHARFRAGDMEKAATDAERALGYPGSREDAQQLGQALAREISAQGKGY
ncbi:MAG: tetratricopeptide repeat protein [Proteobacteria bacterium]|nr:tetratricopeptide repeat protein [Pseudomonadota bacterium]